MFRRFIYGLLLLIVLLLLGPLAVYCSGQVDMKTPWRQADRQRVHLAPDPAKHTEALVQVYVARAFNWRGLFAVHTWIATKAKGASHYMNFQVVGWNYYRHKKALVVNQDYPDREWFGHAPVLLGQLDGAAASAAIKAIKQAARAYPYRSFYRAWPGPNSNTFAAYVLRAVPEWTIPLPSNAVGAHYFPQGGWGAKTVAGDGYETSWYGLLGVSLAKSLRVELTFLGLSFGLDWPQKALLWPGVGCLGFACRL
jgi:hypothetical protein